MKVFVKVVLLGVLVVFAGCVCLDEKGTVEIVTSPPGCLIYINGEAKGKSPYEFEWRRDNPSLVEVVKVGCEPQTEKLTERWFQHKLNEKEVKISHDTKWRTRLIFYLYEKLEK